MAHQLAHFDIYREELAKAYPGFGYALWEPGPGEQNPHVEVGDVGFVREGQFNRLFNALLPGEHESHGRFRVGVPEGHEPLRLTVADHINRRDLTPNTFHSHGVSVQSGGLQVLAATTVGSAEVSFSCTRKHGAALSLPVSARCENTLTLGHFRKWMIKHIDSWLAFTHMHGLGLEMEDIVLVMGCHRTRSWSNIAFNEFRKDAQFSLGVEVAGSFGASINWRASSLRVQGAVLSQGPSGENLPENQCIFIRGFRVKRLLWGLFPRIEAAAEPKPDPPADDREPEREVVSIPNVTEYRDPLHVLLQHIAKRAPDCHMALVHDDDLERILQVDDGTSLETLQPDVVMNHLEKSQLEIGVMSNPLPSDDQSSTIDTGYVRVAMLSEHLKEYDRPRVLRSDTSHAPVGIDESAQSDTPASYLSEVAPPAAIQGALSELDVHGSGNLPGHRLAEYLVHTRSHSGDEKRPDFSESLIWAPYGLPTTTTASFPSDGIEKSHLGWGPPLPEIYPEDSVSNMLAEAATPPLYRDSTEQLGPPPLVDPATAEITEPMKRKRTSLVSDSADQPARKRTALLSLAPPPEPLRFVKEEPKAAQSTFTSPEPKHVPATSIEELTIKLKEKDMLIEQLIQDNFLLRDEINNLSRTFETKFEKMLEKTEDRIQGPIERLLKELGRRTSPLTPAHVSSIKTTPQNAQSVPDFQAEGEGSGGAPGTVFPGRYVGNRHGAIYPSSYPPLPEGWQIVRVSQPASTPAAAPPERSRRSPPTYLPALASTSAPASALATTPVPKTFADGPRPLPGLSDLYPLKKPPTPPSKRSHTYPYHQSHEPSAPLSPSDLSKRVAILVSPSP